jgi:small subunit ribosomal protein S16
LPTRIRLKRIGGKHDPHFRIVIADSRTQRDGKTIEEIGYYNPTSDPPTVNVNGERALHWLRLGAQPSDTVRSLLTRAGVMAQLAPPRRPAEVEADEPISEEVEPASDEEEEVEA